MPAEDGRAAATDEAASAGGDRYRAAFTDWLACASRGFAEPAARAASAAGDPIVALGTAGHVLDFDDTFLPGIAHLSAPVAPAALALGAHEGKTVGEVLAAYADGFEAMGALAAAGHPALYDRGWHPTAVCGAAGAAVGAARLLGADPETAAALAALRAGGLRAAFGSDGKSIQVGLAAATGVAAARLAKAGATVPADRIAAAWHDTYGGRWATAAEEGAGLAVSRNWIKAWPCCLQTHGAIECAERVGAAPDGPIIVLAHPVSRQAASYDAVETPLQAKFSIPYTTAFTLLHGGPRVDDFNALEPATQTLAERITVRTDDALQESEFALLAGDEELARVDAARGSPQHPLSAGELQAKVHALAGDRFERPRRRRAGRRADRPDLAPGRSLSTGAGGDHLAHGVRARIVAEPVEAPCGARLLPRPEVGPRHVIDHDVEPGRRLDPRDQLRERLRPVEVDGEHAVPAPRALERAAVGPARRDPHRDPRLLHRHGLELAAPQRHQPLEVGVELPRPLAHVVLLAERPELAVGIAADAHAEHQPPPAQPVERDRLARELVDPPARGRGDERADAHARSGASDRRHRHPRVGDVGHGRAVDHVIPDEAAVPPGRLRLGSELREHARLGQLPERGDEDPSLGAQPKMGNARRRARVSMPSWIDCWTSSYLRST